MNDINIKNYPFIHLRVFSSYSLLEGTLHPDDIVKLAIIDNMPAVSIVDRNNLFGSLEFSEYCINSGVQPLIAILIKLDIEEKKTTTNFEIINKKYDYIVLFAKDYQGYENLLYLSSYSYIENHEKDAPFISFDILKKYSQGLLAITGGKESLIYDYLTKDKLDEADHILNKIYNLFTNRLYIEISRLGYEEEEKNEDYIINLAEKYKIPIIATNPVYYKDSSISDAHEVLTCISSNNVLVEENRRKFTNQHYFRSQKEMKELFADIPQAINNTAIFARRCAIKIPTRDPILPDYPTHDNRTQEEELKFVAMHGLKERLEKHVYENDDIEINKQIFDRYLKRLNYELDVITSMKFSGYFLIVSDFIKYAKAKKIPVGPGRGSGAGSLVAWCLEITDLDPIRFGLIFERFLNPERISMPDFDIDFCQERRGEVIEYVQNKYGYDHVAQILTIGKLQARAVLRDVGRVLQIPYPQVDRICKLVPNNPARPVTLAQALELDKELLEAYQKQTDNKKLIDLGLKLEGLNRHVSMHAAGIVISRDKLHKLVPLYRDPRSKMPVTQYSMKYVEKSGLVKFDFLGLKTLTTINQAFELIKENRNIYIDVNEIDLKDINTYKMLGSGNSIGIFQLESSGMRDTLCKLKPDCIEDIIALISLYRPGPMDNIPVYIACKHKEKEPDYLHPKLKDVLKETFGVIIYQEQVMQIAQILAGYSLGGADILRRAMGKKIQSEMDMQRKIFVDGAMKNHVSHEDACFIFDLVNKFAGYGFNKSHAAAYALISYQTAWLKANYPQEFYVATINLDIHDTDKIYLFCHDAKKNNIKILPPNVNCSKAYFFVENHEGNLAIRYGLAGLKSVGVQAAEEIEKSVRENGAFKDIFDFAKRINGKNLNKRILEALVKSGALDSIIDNRQQIIKSIDLIVNYGAKCEEETNSLQINLFGGDDSTILPVPQLAKISDFTRKEKLNFELEIIGFYLDNHPLDDYLNILEKLDVHFIRDLEKYKSGDISRIKIVGVVPDYKTKISKKGKYAFVQLSDPGGHCEFSIFNSELLANSREFFDNNIPIVATVDIRHDQGGLRIIADDIISLDQYLTNIRLVYKVKINDLTEIDKLKNIINNAKSGKGRMVALYETKDKHKVELNISQKIFIPNDLLKHIDYQLEIE